MTVQHQYRVSEKHISDSPMYSAYRIIDGQCIVLCTAPKEKVEEILNFCISFYQVASKKRRVLDDKKSFVKKIFSELDRLSVSSGLDTCGYDLTYILFQERSLYVIQKGHNVLYFRRGNDVSTIEMKEYDIYECSLVYQQHNDEFFLTTQSVGQWVTRQESIECIEKSVFDEIPQLLIQRSELYGNRETKIVVAWKTKYLTTQQSVF